MEKVELKRGDKGLQVKLVQEWLCLNGILVDIDGAFGPATKAGVKKFQTELLQGVVHELRTDGVVDDETLSALCAPLERAKKYSEKSATIGETIIRVASAHLVEHPREVGGQNRGPWVRAYCGGRDGKEWLWCAGFVCTILEQAFKAHKLKPPFPRTYGCDTIAKMNASKLVRPANGDEAQRFGLRPGAIFLIRKTETDWVHTGICTAFHDETFETIEGNSNDEGSREGHELCARMRGYRRKDFILV